MRAFLLSYTGIPDLLHSSSKYGLESYQEVRFSSHGNIAPLISLIIRSIDWLPFSSIEHNQKRLHTLLSVCQSQRRHGYRCGWWFSIAGEETVVTNKRRESWWVTVIVLAFCTSISSTPRNMPNEWDDSLTNIIDDGMSFKTYSRAWRVPDITPITVIVCD